MSLPSEAPLAKLSHCSTTQVSNFLQISWTWQIVERSDWKLESKQMNTNLCHFAAVKGLWMTLRFWVLIIIRLQLMVASALLQDFCSQKISHDFWPFNVWWGVFACTRKPAKFSVIGTIWIQRWWLEKWRSCSRAWLDPWNFGMNRGILGTFVMGRSRNGKRVSLMFLGTDP